MIYIIIYGIIAGLMCIYFINRKGNGFKKHRQIKNLIIMTCNTILYCVLYIKMDMIDFIFYSPFITILLYLGIHDSINKKITNRCNAVIGLLGIIKIVVSDLVLAYNINHIIITIVIIIITFSLMYALKKLSGDRLGGGDVKFISLLPLYYSYNSILYIILVSSIIASMYGLYLIIIKNKKKDYEMGYGLFLSIACIVMLLI